MYRRGYNFALLINMDLWYALIVMAIGISISLSKADDCIAERISYPVYKMFNSNGVPLETIEGRFEITSRNDSDECTLSMRNIVDLINFPDYVVVGRIIFNCKRLITIHIDDFETRILSNVISFFQLEHCIIDIANVDKIGHLTDLRVVTFYHSNVTVQQNFSNTSCSGLQNAVSFWIEVDPDSGIRPDVERILGCQEKFPIITEVGFRNMSWDILPVYVEDKFPHLQALDLTYNSFRRPPDFPWADKVEVLPVNLSRTPYFQDHYSASFNLHIPAHIFRRVLFLDHNNITDLRNHTFSGLLHMLSIKSNGLEWIGQQTFSSLRGIQTLLLSFNRLTRIPGRVFHNLGSLKHLDLRRNNLTDIDIVTFKRLYNLQYLNLANNMITTLQSGLFSHLRNLKKLHLEFNAIHTVSRNFLAADSIELNFVYLHHNPIFVLPDIFLLLRKLEMVDLKWTNISFDNFNEFLENIPFEQFSRSIQKSASESAIDFERRPEKYRDINLANSQISRIILGGNTTTEQKQKLALLLKHFRLNLDNNPIVCDCKIIEFNVFMERLHANKSMNENDNLFKSWKCAKPESFHGRAMLGVQPEETYCQLNVSFCPPVCECSRRHGSGIIIVDCRGRGLVQLPKRLPDGLLDLWFQENNVTEIRTRHYSSRIRQLYMSNNLVSYIEDGFFTSTASLKNLRLDGNRLTYLHTDMRNLHQTVIHIEHNPFRCDCKTLWMKQWMADNKFFIRDLSEIVCNTGKETDEGRQFILVPDDEFVCRRDFDVIMHVVAPTLSLLIVVILLVSVYVFRIEIKVLLYVYFGVHPFDKDKIGHNDIDALIVHSTDLTEWVFQNIVHPLENCHNRLTVCDIMRDFKAGLSFQENISRLVNRSRRLVLCISRSMKPENEIFQIAWNDAREKIKESKTNFAIIVSYDVPLKTIKEKELSRFIRPGRYLKKSDALFKQKLIYSMPCDKRQNGVPETRYPRGTRQFVDSYDVTITQEAQFDIFISYADRDIPFLLRHLQPELEEKGYRLCIPDRDFMPGAAKEENILGAIAKSRWTLFILSGAHLQDEWSLFVFRAARGKSLREKSNHLVVVVMDEIKTDTMDEEVVHYLKTYVSIQSDDKWFWHRLSTAMPLKSNACVNPNVKTNDRESNWDR